MMSPRTLWLGLLTLALALVAMLTAVSLPAEAAIAPTSGVHGTQGALVPTVAQASLDVSSVKDYYFAGDIITVTVRLTNLENFFGGELRWTFNANSLEVVDMD